MRKILTARSSFPSAMLIRDSIEEITGRHFFVVNNPTNIRDILFRYGNPANVRGNDPQFNSAEFISMARDKEVFSQFCQKNQIYSPIFHRITEPPKEFPVLVRRTLTGFGGTGISFCHNREEYESKIRSDYWWTEFVECKYEIRVHLFNTTVNRIYKKERDGEDNLPIRNTENGYHFALKESVDKYEQAKLLASRLGELFLPIGGHFCGIDMGYDKKRKEYFVFEINSAPGLNTSNAKEYAKFFCQNLNLEEE